MATDEEEWDPWHLSSGLAEKYTGTIKDPVFGFKADYMDGTRLLFMIDVQTDDGEIGDNGMVSEQYTVGDGWEAAEKGAKCQREDGKRKAFNQNSGYGLFIKAAIDAGAGDVLRERAGADGPMRADVWEGLTFDFERKEFSGTVNGEKRSWARMLPVKFHNNGTTATKATKAAPKAEATEVPKTESNGNGNGTGDYGLAAGTLAKLKARAKKASTHDEFIELCYSELAEDMQGAVEDVVMDPAGLYAEVKG